MQLRSVTFTGFDPNITTNYSDPARPGLGFAGLSHIDPAPAHMPARAHITNPRPGCFVLTFDNQPVANDTVIFISAVTARRTELLGRLVLQAMFLDETQAITLGLDKIMDPTEGANQNKFGLPPSFSVRLVFAPDPSNDPDAVEQHRAVVAFVADHPFDTVRPAAPPVPPKTTPSPRPAPPVPPKPVDLLSLDAPEPVVPDLLSLDPPTAAPAADLLGPRVAPAQPAPSLL